jgi:hypothetical protein
LTGPLGLLSLPLSVLSVPLGVLLGLPSGAVFACVPSRGPFSATLEARTCSMKASGLMLQSSSSF